MLVTWGVLVFTLLAHVTESAAVNEAKVADEVLKQWYKDDRAGLKEYIKSRISDQLMKVQKIEDIAQDIENFVAEKKKKKDEVQDHEEKIKMRGIEEISQDMEDSLAKRKKKDGTKQQDQEEKIKMRRIEDISQDMEDSLARRKKKDETKKDEKIKMQSIEEVAQGIDNELAKKKKKKDAPKTSNMKLTPVMQGKLKDYIRTKVDVQLAKYEKKLVKDIIRRKVEKAISDMKKHKEEVKKDKPNQHPLIGDKKDKELNLGADLDELIEVARERKSKSTILHDMIRKKIEQALKKPKGV